MSDAQERILVVRLGALGDLVFCLQSFEEIRHHHPDADIALLTRSDFVPFAQTLPWFDRIIVDTHPSYTDVTDWLDLIRAIKKFNPTRVYDLQGKNRQSVLYAFLGGPFGPLWSGAAPGCAFPRVWPPGPTMSFTDFLAAQLRAAGVPAQAPLDPLWLDAQTGKFGLMGRYVALVPGSSPAASWKRWPEKKYAELVERLEARGLDAVVVGTEADRDACEEVCRLCPKAINLCAQTNLLELAGVFRHAVAVIGNDTGPTHMAGAVGVPTLALFSSRSNAVWSKPPGPISAVLQIDQLARLDSDAVECALLALLKQSESKRG